MATGVSDLTNLIVSQADVLINLASSLVPVQRLITGTAYLIGIFFALKAFYTLKTFGEQRSMMSQQSNIKEPILYLIVSAGLIYLPTSFQIFMNTTFGYNSILAYAAVNSGSSTIVSWFGASNPAGAALTLMIQTIGLVAFIRGWILLANSAAHGQPPGGTGKGLTHIIGGILAMNIVGTLQIIDNTLYGS